MDLDKVIQNLFESLAHKLGIPVQTSLSSEFISAAAKKLHVKTKEPSLDDVLERMKVFGLDLDHIDLKLLKSGDQYQIYFFLDILNVLLDSIFEAKMKRRKDKSGGVIDISPDSSGGEEISKILDYARKTYGRVQSIRKEADKENLNAAELKPQKFKVPQPSLVENSSTDISLDSVDNVVKPLLKPPPVRHKRTKETVKESTKTVSKSVLNESEDEINVKIPTSDTTDVIVKVKPLDNNKDLKNKRIHVRINKAVTPDRVRSNRIIYGRKSIIGHHLRKTRSPMFSRRPVTPKLDKKTLIKNVIDFTEQAKRDELLNQDAKPRVNKELEAKLKCQQLIREKRTNAAQLRKLVKRIN